MEYEVLAGHSMTYSQSTGTSGSLVSGLASITLKEVKRALGTGDETSSDYSQNATFLPGPDLQKVP